MSMSRLTHRISLALVMTFLAVHPGLAQAPSPLSQPNPQAPVLSPVMPLGMQRGTSLELTLTGTNLNEPTALWTSFPAKITIPTDNNNGKDAAKLRVMLEVPKDAPLGFHSLRLATTRGMSNARLFCLDDLPQVLATVGANRTRATALAVPTPCVVVGRIDAETSDCYKVSAKAGQRLTFEMLGHRLGSAFDPQLTLFDARNGRELPGGYSNDAPGCQTDPRLTYTFKETGDYLVEVRDVLYRGGPEFGYRLRIGDFPCATTPIPMAAKRGSKVTVNFAGPNSDGIPPVEVTVPADPAVDTVWVAPIGANGLPGWPVALAVSDLDEIVEQEPNNEQAKATRVPVPGGVTGRFEQKGDVDYYVFTAKKGQRLILEAHTLELYSPTEVYMVLRDAKGTQVAVTNPMAAPRLDFNPPADGDFFLSVEHLLYAGGPAESYRVTIRPYEPGFSLSMFLDRYQVAQGGHVTIPIALSARRDYTGPIEVSVIGNPAITGQVTIPAGAAPAPPPPAVPPAAATLVLTVKPELPMGAYPLVIQGKATINGKTVVEQASVAAVVKQSLGGLAYPPRQMLTEVGLAVTERPPFTLTAKFDPPEALRGGPATATITTTRDAGFAEEIVLSVAGQPANVAPALKNIAKDQSEVKVQLNAAANAALGSFPITFTGKAKFQNKELTVNALPVPLVLVPPFELKVEPVPVKLAPEEKVKIKVTAVRKGGYQGPISVELRNLPANVAAPKADIAPDQTQVEIELTAAANAARGDKADVNALGTATAASNQQNASANFTISVVKK
jgi:hypothetical protein